MMRWEEGGEKHMSGHHWGAVGGKGVSSSGREVCVVLCTGGARWGEGAAGMQEDLEDVTGERKTLE